MRATPLLLSCLALVSIAATPMLEPGRGPRVGEIAPPISAEVWQNHIGQAPSLADLRGHVVLVEFWATW